MVTGASAWRRHDRGSVRDMGDDRQRAGRLWPVVVVFLVATVVHSLWLVALQIATGVDAGLVALFQLGPSLGLLTTWLILPARLASFLPGPPESGSGWDVAWPSPWPSWRSTG